MVVGQTNEQVDDLIDRMAGEHGVLPGRPAVGPGLHPVAAGRPARERRPRAPRSPTSSTMPAGASRTAAKWATLAGTGQ